MSLTKKQHGIVHLIKRSNADDGGWYCVSALLWPLVSTALPTDLLEIDPLSEGGRVRFTDRGKAVADYL